VRRSTVDPNIRRLFVLLSFVTTFVALSLAKDVFIPIALALLLSFVLTPLADSLERRGLHRVVSAVMVVLVLCVVTLGLGYVVGDQVYRFALDLPQYRDEITSKVGKIRGVGGSMAQTIDSFTDGMGSSAADAGSQGASTQPVESASSLLMGSSHQATTQPATLGQSSSNPMFVQPVGDEPSPLSNIADYLGFVLSPLGTAGIVLVLLLFMLLERNALRDRFIRLSSSGRYTLTTQALQDATTRISRYLRAQLIVNGSYGVAVSGALWVIGAVFGDGQSFPSFVLWGTLCALLRFIPYVGPWVAAVFPLAVSLAVYEGFGVFAAVGVTLVVIELISNNVMEPLLYGSSTGLSTVALLVSAVVWTWLWGPVGLLLATPLTVCLVVLGKYVPALKFLDVLLGDQPALPPGVRFYQRLLAGNRREAMQVLDEAAEELDDLAAAADRVLIPALKLARHDRHRDELNAEQELHVYDQITMLQSELDEELTVPESAPSLDAPLLLAMPSHHRSECVIAQGMALLIRPMNVRVEPLPCSLLPVDIEERIAVAKPLAIYLSVLPPGGMTQARYLCRRLRRRFKDLVIIVGYFGNYRDYDALLVRFRAAGASYVTTNLHQGRSQIALSLNLKSPEHYRKPDRRPDVKPEVVVDDVRDPLTPLPSDPAHVKG
jgi:predicted PurR-regulated permease PerM